MPPITKASQSPQDLSRGQLARRTACNGETIRYYEKIGLLPPPRRSAGGRRLYDEKDVRRLVFIRRCRELGFRLDDIRGLLRLVDGGQYTCAEILALTHAHVAQIRTKIRDLRRMERVLTAMMADCKGGAAPECAIIDALTQPPAT